MAFTIGDAYRHLEAGTWVKQAYENCIEIGTVVQQSGDHVLVQFKYGTHPAFAGGGRIKPYNPDWRLDSELERISQKEVLLLKFKYGWK